MAVDTLSIEYQYHKEASRIRGEKDLFVEKRLIEGLLGSDTLISPNLCKEGDFVAFFDSLGNIYYQARVFSNDSEGIKLICKNLRSGKKEITPLNYDLIPFPYAQKPSKTVFFNRHADNK